MNTPSSVCRADIAAFAERLALEYCPAAPIDPERIAAAAGLTFCYASFPQKFDGLLLYEEERFVLVCNNRRHPRGSDRSRFTFAHELGHYFIPSHRRALMAGMLAARLPRRGAWDRRFTEQEADRFAVNLLMPMALFYQAAANLSGPALGRIKTLAETFGTSLTATAYRALELDLFPSPAAVILWDSLGAHACRRLSTETLELGRPYRAVATTPPPGSITARVIEKLAVGLHQADAHVMDWFTDLDGYEPEHQIALVEEVFSLGDHGWMTLLHPEKQL